jgi:tRNA-dihydrouridine synthase A
MMDWTDRHERYFLRLIAPQTVLFTEMITAEALHFGPRERLLGFDPAEKPLVLQLGGSDPQRLAQAAVWGEEAGYDEINLNVGCPSDRVQSGRFGACLMAKPQLVADCVAAMRDRVTVPVTVKHRLGIDDLDSDHLLDQFIDVVAAAGCRVFYIHARKAYLTGLSPKQNRDVPPLQYERVHRQKARRPELSIVLNGGLKDPQTTLDAIATLDGAMIGREAYQNPCVMAAMEHMLIGRQVADIDRAGIAHEMADYIDCSLGQSLQRPQTALRHLHGLYRGQPGAKHWRLTLAELGPTARSARAVIERALPPAASASAA